MASKPKTFVVSSTGAGSKVAVSTGFPANTTEVLTGDYLIQASKANASTAVVGGDDVTAANGIELDAGEFLSAGDVNLFAGRDDPWKLTEVYIHFVGAADSVRVLYPDKA